MLFKLFKNAMMTMVMPIVLSNMVSTISLAQASTETWLKESASFNLAKIIENISPPDGDKGAIIAAKTRENPNYYYHWVRDAGITMDTLSGLYPERSTEEKIKLRILFFDYVTFSKKIQAANSLTGLGEPKFNVDGSTYNEPWARPQDDSPAMRAISMIDWAWQLIADGHESDVRKFIYTKNVNDNPIRKDLDYVVARWQESSFDLWEEVRGKHFYTLMIERRALLQGAKLARYFNDEVANQYQTQAKAIEPLLESFWDGKRGYLVATVDRTDGVNYKDSNLDSGVLLGLLHGDMHDGFLRWDDPRVIATIDATVNAFKALYPINHVNTIPGVAIGRYPEDRYAGSNFNGGNPWVLCTLAIAEAYYRYAAELNAKGQTEAAEAMLKRGDQFIERVRYHAQADGSLNEQIDKNTGYMTSVEDLTWNYAALLQARQSLFNHQ